MKTVKKLFLITAILGSAINTQLSASEPQQDPTNLLNIADHLQRKSERESMIIAGWIRTTYNSIDNDDKQTTDKLLKIANSNNSPEDKEQSIKAIWQKETTPKNNDGYFSNISTKAKAAAAFMITAGIISYLYFTRPWITSPAQ